MIKKDALMMCVCSKDYSQLNYFKDQRTRIFLPNFLINCIFLIVFPMIYFRLQTGFSFTEQRFGRYKSFYVSFIDY